MEDIIISVLQRTLIAGTPLLLGTIGEVICERSGILNLGVEGVMSIGAVTAFIVTFYTNSPWMGLYAAVLAGNGAMLLPDAWLGPGLFIPMFLPVITWAIWRWTRRRQSMATEDS